MNISDKVVCIDDSPCDCGCSPAFLHSDHVRVGQTYVVIATELDYQSYRGQILFIKLVGVKIPESESHLADWIEAWRFRKLEDIKQINRSKQNKVFKRLTT